MAAESRLLRLLPDSRAQLRLNPLDHGGCADLSHAGVTMRALRQSPKIAGRTSQVCAHDCAWTMIRTDLNGIRRAEHAHYRTVEGDGEMHRAGIVGHTNGRSLYDGSEFGRSGPTGTIDRATAELYDLLAAEPIVFSAQDQNAEPLRFKPSGDFRKSLRIPVLRLPGRSRNHCNESVQPIVFEEPLRSRLNLGG